MYSGRPIMHIYHSHIFHQQGALGRDIAGRHRITTFFAPCHTHLDKLQESTVDRRAQWLDVLVELDGGGSALGNTFGRELEFLQEVLV